MKKCPICLGARFGQYYQNSHYEIERCQKCGYARINNPPPPAEIKRIYRKGYFDDKNNIDYFAEGKKKFTALSKYLKPKSRILDYGCGLGDFVAHAQKAGHTMQGYDISEFAAQETAKRYHVTTSAKPVSETFYPRNHFDAISSFDVIEHIPDFMTALKHFHRWLKPGGLLFLTTPDLDSWDARLLGRRWWGYQKLPEHLHHFSRRPIRQALEQAGFTNITIKQWGFSRTMEFVLTDTYLQKLPFAKIILSLLTHLRLHDKPIFFPMFDMIVICRKKK